MGWNDGRVYRAAREADGDLIHIYEAAKQEPHGPHGPHGPRYFGITCSKPVFRKSQGKVRAWHFAHYERCDECTPESDLHLFTVRGIKDGVNNAIAEGRPYTVRYLCPDCNSTLREENIAYREGHAEVEEEVYEGTRSDVVIHGRYTTIIGEVVVTHEDPQHKRDIYATHRTPILYIRPATWRNADGTVLPKHWSEDETEDYQRKLSAMLRTGFPTNEYINVSVGPCSNPGCTSKQAVRRHEHEKDTEREAWEDFQLGLWRVESNDEHDSDDLEAEGPDDEGTYLSSAIPSNQAEIDDAGEAVDDINLPYQENPWEALNQWFKEKRADTEAPHFNEDKAANYARWEDYDRRVEREYQRHRLT